MSNLQPQHYNIPNLALPETQEKERFLNFPINKNFKGLVALASLQGVVQLSFSEILPIPETPPALSGILSWRGEAIWTVNLPLLLGETESLTENREKSHCFSAITSLQGKSLGLLVETFTSVVSYNPEEDLQPLRPRMISSEARHYLQGYFLSEDQTTPYFLLDLNNIFEILN